MFNTDNYINGEIIYNYLINLSNNHKILNNSVGVTLRTIKENGPHSEKYGHMCITRAYEKWFKDNQKMLKDLKVIECYLSERPEVFDIIFDGLISRLKERGY